MAAEAVPHHPHPLIGVILHPSAVVPCRQFVNILLLTLLRIQDRDAPATIRVACIIFEERARSSAG